MRNAQCHGSGLVALNTVLCAGSTTSALYMPCGCSTYKGCCSDHVTEKNVCCQPTCTAASYVSLNVVVNGLKELQAS